MTLQIRHARRKLQAEQRRMEWAEKLMSHRACPEVEATCVKLRNSGPLRSPAAGLGALVRADNASMRTWIRKVVIREERDRPYGFAASLSFARILHASFLSTMAP